MSSKIEILSQVMLSLKSDQNKTMNDINSLLNNRDKEVGLVDSLKDKIRSLSLIHSDMQETQAFILQLTQGLIPESQKEQKNKTDDSST